ncbi:hypothetical protein BDZ91DRAFT_768051 [Kalaharituber pfeilii]|nr:hypothetical protein BDZ91DRAFT_768051 [Kalaharituber pfeilii]
MSWSNRLPNLIKHRLPNVPRKTVVTVTIPMGTRPTNGRGVAIPGPRYHYGNPTGGEVRRNPRFQGHHFSLTSNPGISVHITDGDKRGFHYESRDGCRCAMPVLRIYLPKGTSIWLPCKCYAVARGRTPGIYFEYHVLQLRTKIFQLILGPRMSHLHSDDVEVQVSRYPNARHKKFSKICHAMEYLEKHGWLVEIIYEEDDEEQEEGSQEEGDPDNDDEAGEEDEEDEEAEQQLEEEKEAITRGRR